MFAHFFSFFSFLLIIEKIAFEPLRSSPWNSLMLYFVTAVSAISAISALDWKDLQWTLVFTLFMPTFTLSFRNVIITGINFNIYRQYGLVCAKSLLFPYVALDPLMLYSARGCTVGESAAFRFLGRVGLSCHISYCFLGDALTIHCSPVPHCIHLPFTQCLWRALPG